MAKKKRIETSGGDGLGSNPFDALDARGLPKAPRPAPAKKAPAKKAAKKRGRVDVRREKAGRGGKEVIVLAFENLRDPHQLNALAKELKAACATGGAVKGGNIEIQGDQREKIAKILEEKGFRCVLAGG